MKKLFVPVAVLVFFLSATPAFAANRWGFSFSIGPFHFGDPPETAASPDRIIPPNPPIPYLDEEGIPYPTGRPIKLLPTLPRPTEFDYPTVTPKPAKAVRPSKTPRPTDDVDEIDTEKKGATGPKGSSGDNRGNAFGATGNVGSEAAKIRREETLRLSVTKMYENYQHRLDQYKEFIAKLKSRREKFQEMGKDVTALSAEIKDAEGALVVGQNVVNAAIGIVGKLDYSGDIQTVRKTILAQNKIVREALTNLYNISRHTVDTIQEISVQPTHTVKPINTSKTTPIPKVTNQQNRPLRPVR